MSYKRNIQDGLTVMREWMATQHIAPDQLPDDPWNLPKDCPIWHMGLSMAQAGGILASVRSAQAREG